MTLSFYLYQQFRSGHRELLIKHENRQAIKDLIDEMGMTGEYGITITAGFSDPERFRITLEDLRNGCKMQPINRKINKPKKYRHDKNSD